MGLIARWQAHRAHLRGCRLFARGDSATALKHFDRALELRPGEARLHLRRGLPLAELGRQAEAVKAAREATRLRPRNPATWLFLGRVLFDSGRLADALAAFEQSLALETKNGLALAARGLALLALDKWEEAGPLLRSHLVDAGPDLLARLLLTCESFLWSRRDKARSFEQQLEERERPSRRAAWGERTTSRLRLAIALLGAGLRFALSPKRRAAAFALARAEEDFFLEHYQEAAAGFQRAADLGADEKEVALRLGECALLLGRFDEADRWLGRLSEAELSSPSLSAMAGVAALHRNRFAEAEERLALAARRSSRDFAPAYCCGLACIAQGKLRPARDWFRQALSCLNDDLARLRLEEYLRLKQG